MNIKKWSSIIFLLLYLVLAGCENNDTPPRDVDYQNSSSGSEKIEYQLIDNQGEVVQNIAAPECIVPGDVVEMESDYSCGSASLATVLKFSDQDNADEYSVVTGSLTFGNTSTIQERHAISLLDFKKYLANCGYSGSGYYLDDIPDFETFEIVSMATYARTMLMPIQINGYKSFCVFYGYDENYIYLGHPIFGNICISFEQADDIIYKRIVFIVSPQGQDPNQIDMASTGKLRVMDDDSLEEIFEPESLWDTGVK